MLFFVAVGSLIDPAALMTALPALGLVIGLVVVAKVGVSYLLARVGQLPRPLQLAVGLGQVGEFSFVIVSVGVAAGVVPAAWFAATLGAVVITIAASAVVARSSGRRGHQRLTATAAGSDRLPLRYPHRHGEVAERFMAAVLKTVERKFRGFESLPLRHTTCHAGGHSPGRDRHRRPGAALFRLETSTLTTAAVTARITRAVIDWAAARGWATRVEARVGVGEETGWASST